MAENCAGDGGERRSFNVADEERRRIHLRRRKAFRTEQSDDDEPLQDVVGLALSGGGLRSALFNDGFLQAISHRGLLRYVDFLASVSGGAYIAGHLASHSAPKSEQEDGGEQPADPSDADASQPPSFHDNKVDWHFGRDPQTGREDSGHLPSIGGYLSQSGKFFGGYWLNQLPVFLFHISCFGILGTLLALFYRWFDAPVFRDVYHTALGIRFGGECLIAFLPPLLLGLSLAATFGTIRVLARVARRVRGEPGTAGRRSNPVVTATKYGMVLVALGAVASAAVFLGNDLTDVGGQATNWHLNKFATYVAITTGVIQIIVFLGRDRLFKSERQDSPYWTKVVQAVASHGAMLFFLFAIVHLMAQENISEFTSTRDPYVMRGEVESWPYYVQVMSLGQAAQETESRGAKLQQRLERLDYERWCRKHVRGSSFYAEAVDQRELTPLTSGLGEAALDPATPLYEQGVPRTSNYWAGYGWLAMSLLDPGKRPPPSPKTPAPRASPIAAAQQFHANQARYLRDHEVRLESKQLTNSLLWSMLGPSELDEPLTHWQRLQADPVIAARIAKLPSMRRRILETALKRHDYGSLPASNLLAPTVRDGYGWSVWERVGDPPQQIASRVRLNRDLIELSKDASLKPFHVASTPVVQPYDQRARWRWLTLWLFGLVVALLCTQDVNRHAFIFRYYRDAISNRFLVRSICNDEAIQSHANGETDIAKLQPENAGLPMPIYLAAWSKPETRYGAMTMRPRGAALTPLGMKLYDDPEEWTRQHAPATAATAAAAVDHAGAPPPAAHDAHDAPATFSPWKDYKPRPGGEPLSLGDVVATSGAAITPFMSNNFSLAAIMDFFGARLGMWVRRPGARPPLLSKSGWIVELLAVVAAVLALIKGDSLLLWGAFLAALCAAVQLRWCVGYPQIIASYVQQLMTNDPRGSDGAGNWPILFLADGGFHDYLGVTELIDRRCDLIVVSDAGCNRDATMLESLARMCEQASSDFGVRFVNLDHDAPIDFQRLSRDDQQNVPQPYLLMRVVYPTRGGQPAKSGLLLYAQMAIAANDPIEIQQIRSRFPSFPDEPTTNQFYTEEQVAAYRNLGYHVGSRICSQLCRWTDFTQDKEPPGRQPGEQPAKPPGTRRQPYFEELLLRIRRAYVQMCFEEFYYNTDDVYGESIWRDLRRQPVYPSWSAERQALRSFAETATDEQVCEYWLERFRRNADVFSVYLDSVNAVINQLAAQDVPEPSGVEANQERENGEADAAGETTLPLASNFMFGSWENYPVTSPDATPQELREFKAHWVAMAAACQQLHQGVPSAIFQVGGRRKLVSLVHRMCEQLRDSWPDFDASPDLLAKKTIHEVHELNECVFQTASLVAVVSFVQCIVAELAMAAEAGLHTHGPAKKEASGDDSDFEFRLLLDFRQLFKEALLCGYPSRTADLIENYYLAMQGGRCAPGDDLSDGYNALNKVSLDRDIGADSNVSKTPRA